MIEKQRAQSPLKGPEEQGNGERQTAMSEIICDPPPGETKTGSSVSVTRPRKSQSEKRGRGSIVGQVMREMIHGATPFKHASSTTEQHKYGTVTENQSSNHILALPRKCTQQQQRDDPLTHQNVHPNQGAGRHRQDNRMAAAA